MAIIKKNELKVMKEPLLKEKLNELRKEMIKVNAQISTGTVPENPGRIKEIKRTIAKINTMLTKLGLEKSKPQHKKLLEVKKPKNE